MAAATLRSSVAITLAAACPAMISRAMFGQVRAATGWPGTSSAITSVIRSSEPCSRPLDRLTIGIHGWIHSRAMCSVERIAVVGTPTTSSSAWRIAFSRSSVAISDSGRLNPGRYVSLVWAPSISSATVELRAQRTVGCRGAIKAATVVPHDPAPRTVTCIATRYVVPAARGHAGPRTVGRRVRTARRTLDESTMNDVADARFAHEAVFHTPPDVLAAAQVAHAPHRHDDPVD